MEKPKKSCCTSKSKPKVEKIIEKTTKEYSSNFKLRADLGVSKISFADGQFITIDEAPDNTCIGFLKANPSRISMFEKYPENWKELITKNENENE
ncbi:hypothetical protein [Flavobacterium sp. HTF]|uniref:hypothetical protein n=1 Tax=Flavobacterium sp. HTF TaxID=2170732 RepID=UPI000D5CAAED|nr:hypothetical protein [Flavobacterium sp. HTF]PWB24659.1 hypothetical protein DCO46_11115 [Flavobacterium sp. HTF]